MKLGLQLLNYRNRSSVIFQERKCEISCSGSYDFGALIFLSYTTRV